ncbi:3786_t:CDS:2 [Ambispora leptoticha]|uniref:3786_t:CDS:1 n=1 Tax=Ambispora leptoticha TaxID=144679 RepID=A0A9N9AHC3_9GLOM|nr:3786_t:CDS:2 [Ambispora leptoticha]
MWRNTFSDTNPGNECHNYEQGNNGNSPSNGNSLRNECLLDSPNPPTNLDQQDVPDQQTIRLLQVIANALAQPRRSHDELNERNVVKIPTFSGGNQDPVEWVDAVTRAFEANNIIGIRRLAVVGAHLSGLAALWWENQTYGNNGIRYWENEETPCQSFVHQFRQAFCTPALINQWNNELLSRRQRVGESVDQYAADMLMMFNRVCRVGNQYPEITKAQMFVQGLCPDLSLAVGPFMPNNLQEAIEKARTCEMTFARGLAAYGSPALYNPLMYPMTQAVVPPYQACSTAQRIVPPSQPMYNTAQPTTPTQTQASANSVDQIMAMLQEADGRGPQGASNVSSITGSHGAFKRGSAPLEGESAQPSLNPSVSIIKEAYMAKRRRGNDDEPVEEETPPVTNHNKEDNQGSTQVNNQANKQGDGKKAVKRKVTKPVEPPVTAKIQPYSIMADLQNKKADITYAQLFQAAPNVRKEALKILRPGRVTKGKLAEFCLNRSDEAYTTSMYCDARVNGRPIILILDSGSSGCVVSAGFLKDSGITIDRPSTVMMVGVHGEQKRPLGEIDEFPVTVGGKTITSRAVVTDAGNYAVIVGNDWMKKARARLDWESCELMIRDGDKKIKVPTEYCKPANIGDRIPRKDGKGKAKADEEDESTDDDDDSSDNDELTSSDEEEYEEEEGLISQTYLYFKFYPVQKEADVVCRICLRKGSIEHDERENLITEDRFDSDESSKRCFGNMVPRIEDNIEKGIESKEQGSIVEECKQNENGEKNKSNKMNKEVSTGSDEPSQASKKGEENLPLSSNQPAIKIEHTDERPNDEIIKDKHKPSDRNGLYTNRFNNGNAEEQCNHGWCYQNGKNSNRDGKKVLERCWKAREGRDCDDKIVTRMTNPIKRNYFMDGVECIPITWAVKKFDQYLRRPRLTKVINYCVLTLLNSSRCVFDPGGESK